MSIRRIAVVLVLMSGMTAFHSGFVHAQTELWGGDFSGSWLVDANWSDGSAPDPGDDVAINATGADYRVDLLANAYVDDLAISSANATLRTGSNGGLMTLNATGSIDIFAGEFQTFGAYNHSAANGLTNHAGVFQIFGHSESTVANGILNMSNGLVRVNGVRNSSGTATFGSKLNTTSFDNQGTVYLETTRGSNGGVFATLSVDGTLNNSGLIDSRLFQGAGTGAKSISATLLNNSGTIVNNDVTTLNLNRSQGDYVNTGTINALAERINFQSVNSFVNQSSGNVVGTEFSFQGSNSTESTLTNFGDINVSGDIAVRTISVFENAGHVHAGGNFGQQFQTYRHRSGATLTGDGDLTFQTVVIDMENGFTTNFSNVNLSGSTIQGSGAYVSQAGTTTSIAGLSMVGDATWENRGDVVLSGVNTISANMNGLFTNRDSGELRLRGFRTNSGFVSAGVTLNLNGGFDNEGTLAIETLHGGGPSPFVRLNISGTFNNSGVIDSRPFEGAAAGTRSISANIIHNSGSIVQRDSGRLIFNRSSAEYTNSGEINVHDGEIRFQNFSTFTNDGTFNIDAGAEVLMTGGAFVNEIDGQILGSGTLISQATTFTDSGTIGPGSSPGVLTMQVNSYLQTGLGVFDMEVGGVTDGIDYDQIVFSGSSASLNGTLRIRFIDGFAPTMDDEFDLLLGSMSENFQQIEILGLEDGFEYSTSVSGGSFTLLALNDGVSSVPEPTGALPACLVAIAWAAARRKRLSC